MGEAFRFDREYGVVLEGGGAKGAYQIGVWKAFLECGVKIKGVAGVSVGALNGALMCMGDYEKAEEIWRNISYSSIMNVDDTQMDHLVNGKFKEMNLLEMGKQSRNILAGGGFDVSPLRRLIEDTVDEDRIKASDMEFIMGTFSLSNLKEIEISAKETETGCLKDYLMASSYFPLFKKEKLHGKSYLDGGIVNNVPIDMLLNRGYKDIIVVRIFGVGMEKKIKIPENVNIIYIAPKVNLCNVLEFNRKKAIRNITIGYYDGMRTLRALAGRDYYIDARRDEIEYLTSLIQLDNEVQQHLLTHYKRECRPGGSAIRILAQEIYPLMAASLKLGKDWDYKEFYFALLEYAAKRMRVIKYRIYSEKEYCDLIGEKIKSYDLQDNKIDIILRFVQMMFEHNNFA